MRLGVHAVSAKMGGAATYITNVVPELVRQLHDDTEESRIILWHSGIAKPGAPWAAGVDTRQVEDEQRTLVRGGAPLRRLWFDQVTLPRVARRERLDGVFATANYCSMVPACRQVLLVRNPIPFDDTFIARMPPRVRLSLMLQRTLTLRSMHAADVVLFPTAAMSDLVAGWTPRESTWRVAHYGALHSRFRPRDAGLPRDGRTVRLLHVSTYSDQKNIGVLLRALEALERETPGAFELQLTAGFDKTWIGKNPAFPNFSADAARFAELSRRALATDVSWTPYADLPELYRRSDIFVFPSYTESFGHPLVEAMASGLPIVAADTPVNRELCGDAAEYAPPFDVQALADTIRRVAGDESLQRRLAASGLARAGHFTWRNHVETVVAALRNPRRDG